MKTAHPFIDRTSLVIVGDHVTLESGTGCVHTAPGHGVDDFNVCQNYPDIPVIVPVDSLGRMTEEAGEKFAGLTTSQANAAIAEHLKETGACSPWKKSSTSILTAGDAKTQCCSGLPSSGSARWRTLRRTR